MGSATAAFRLAFSPRSLAAKLMSSVIKANSTLDTIHDALYLPVQKLLKTDNAMTTAMGALAGGSALYLWSGGMGARPAAWAGLAYSGFYLMQANKLWVAARDKTDVAQ
jgi:hypothetical protein